MTDILAEFFGQFNPEEQAFIRAKEAKARMILLMGQDEAQVLAAGAEFIGYQRVLVRRVTPVCTEGVEQYLRQLSRICAALLVKYGGECNNALAQWLAEAERLAWESLGKQLASGKAGIITTASKPEQPQAGVDNGKAPARVTPAARSAEDIIPEAAPTPAVQPGPAAVEPAPIVNKATVAQPATVTTGADWNAIEVTRRADLLAAYKQATDNPSNKKIYEARNSGIHKPQFYQWVTGELPAHSETTRNFERFLEEKKPPISRRPRA
jgi:hypothetical protein